MITKEIATKLSYRTELWHCSLVNADKTPVRCRVNGVCKVWATRPNEFRLPVKYGLRDCFYITEANGKDWLTPSDFERNLENYGKGYLNVN